MTVTRLPHREGMPSGAEVNPVTSAGSVTRAMSCGASYTKTVWCEVALA